MLYRPEEANEVACPHRSDREGRTLRCLGNRCAAWRWWSYRGEVGYCGLSGRPEAATDRSGAWIAPPEARETKPAPTPARELAADHF
jgi:hypothetical protein